MKIGIVTTTINIPHVLDLYSRQEHPDFEIYVAGDLKTPQRSFEEPYKYLSPDKQKRWSCSEPIGWNTNSRRNIAVLEALADGCEIILSVDDDMIPMNTGMLWTIEELFSQPFNGIQLGASEKWMNYATPLRARGVPLEVSINNTIGFVTDVQIGIVQGIIYGVPDATAVDALACSPFVTSVIEPFATGCVAHRSANAVFNSQLTAFRRELAPFFAQLYRMRQRNTDIFASVAMRWAARNRNLYTYYGPPGAWHDRQPRSLVKDLKAELLTDVAFEEFVQTLNTSDSLLPYDVMLMHYGDREFVDAWLSDIDEAMK